MKLAIPAALEVISQLRGHRIDPILYGSLGCTLYLGDFKDCSDIDLLVPENWVTNDWPKLCKIMHDCGFMISDEREHEFTSNAGITVAFASERVLVRDKIIKSSDEIIRIDVGGYYIRTLSAQGFREAYRFSQNDGYRRLSRGKKDGEVIRLLDNYLASTS